MGRARYATPAHLVGLCPTLVPRQAPRSRPRYVDHRTGDSRVHGPDSRWAGPRCGPCSTFPCGVTQTHCLGPANRVCAIWSSKCRRAPQDHGRPFRTRFLPQPAVDAMATDSDGMSPAAWLASSATYGLHVCTC